MIKMSYIRIYLWISRCHCSWNNTNFFNKLNSIISICCYIALQSACTRANWKVSKMTITITNKTTPSCVSGNYSICPLLYVTLELHIKSIKMMNLRYFLFIIDDIVFVVEEPTVRVSVDFRSAPVWLDLFVIVLCFSVILVVWITTI